MTELQDMTPVELFVVRVKHNGLMLTKPLPKITCEHFVGTYYYRTPESVEIVPAVAPLGGDQRDHA